MLTPLYLHLRLFSLLFSMLTFWRVDLESIALKAEEEEKDASSLPLSLGFTADDDDDDEGDE